MTTGRSSRRILDKFGIERLNPMQIAAQSAYDSNGDIVLLSPTGSGKTLAFLLPLLSHLDNKDGVLQAIILVPSRELALQIEQVARQMGTGHKINAVYGGRPISKDKIELAHPPSVIVGTPGRVADHARRGTLFLGAVKTLILDEFDKCLEIGFSDEMKEIISYLDGVERRILTSATQGVKIPTFVGLVDPQHLNYTDKETSSLKVQMITSISKDKLDALHRLVRHLGAQRGIIFCNYRAGILRISAYLDDQGIEHGCYYGDMEQKDRERALIKYRNGTNQILLATDLAARGIDVPEIKFIIHYHLPLKSHEFLHRNGRTARMNNTGIAYILQWDGEVMPDFINAVHAESQEAHGLDISGPLKASIWQTIFISGGRKDKISKGDIVGFLLKEGGLEKSQVGVIELKQDCSFAAVHRSMVRQVIASLDGGKIKKRKVRIKLI